MEINTGESGCDGLGIYSWRNPKAQRHHFQSLVVVLVPQIIKRGFELGEGFLFGFMDELDAWF